jgi:hypothetical protein
MFYLQYRITPELKLAVTQHGWDTVSNLVYVDQPINTGFSYSDDPSDAVHDEAKVADDMIQFLAEFVQAHPELEATTSTSRASPTRATTYRRLPTRCSAPRSPASSPV